MSYERVINQNITSVPLLQKKRGGSTRRTAPAEPPKKVLKIVVMEGGSTEHSTLQRGMGGGWKM